MQIQVHADDEHVCKYKFMQLIEFVSKSRREVLMCFSALKILVDYIATKQLINGLIHLKSLY